MYIPGAEKYYIRSHNDRDRDYADDNDDYDADVAVDVNPPTKTRHGQYGGPVIAFELSLPFVVALAL